MTATYLDELRSSILPSIAGILTDPELGEAERQQLHLLKCMQRTALEWRERRDEWDPWYWRFHMRGLLDRCRWQRGFIDKIRELEGK
jgi:hypothetical protein